MTARRCKWSPLGLEEARNCDLLMRVQHGPWSAGVQAKHRCSVRVGSLGELP